MVADAARVEARSQRHGELARGAHVEAEPLLRDPTRDGRAEERLARVVDVVVREGLAKSAGAAPEVRLVEDVRRGAVLGDEVPQVHAADLERPRGVLAGGAAPQQRLELVDVRRHTQPGRASGSL